MTAGLEAGEIQVLVPDDYFHREFTGDCTVVGLYHSSVDIVRLI